MFNHLLHWKNINISDIQNQPQIVLQWWIWQKLQNRYFWFGVISNEKFVRDAGWHVWHRQPKELCVPSRRVASTRMNSRDAVLHTADHLHQVPVRQLVKRFLQLFKSWKRSISHMWLMYSAMLYFTGLSIPN